MKCEYEYLLDDELRWLSRLNVSKIIFEMREVLMFLNQHSPITKDTMFDFKDNFSDVNLLNKRFLRYNF